jgi:chromosome segregation ATPase
MPIDINKIGARLKTEFRSVANSLSKAATNLREENRELREKWNRVLEACVNAESEVEHLQDQVETLDLKLADADEAYRRQVSECFRLTAELSSIKVVHTREKADIETRLAKIAREYDTLLKNHTFVMQHKADLEKLINEAKPIMEKFRTENAELKKHQTNAEHLAKQVVKLQSELSKLELTYCPHQKGDTFSLPCGKCVKCKLDAAYSIIERTQNNVAIVEKERDEAERAQQFSKKILEETAKNLTEANKRIATLEASVSHTEECLKQQVAVNVRMERKFHKANAALVTISEASFFTNKKELAKTALASL